MEQQPSHVEAFLLGKALQEDHAEANVIDYYYDFLTNDMRMDASPSLRVEAAIMRAHASMVGQTMPGSHVFGYETAAYAWRWLNFRQAYISDLENVRSAVESTDKPLLIDPAPEGFGSYAEKLAFYEEQQLEATRQLLYNNAVVYDTFANLETERIRCGIDPDAHMIDPFALEGEFALRSVCQVIDRATTRPEALQIDGFSRFTYQPGYPTNASVVELTKQKFRNGRADYTIAEFEGMPGQHDADVAVVPLATYRIDSRPSGIRVWAMENGDTVPYDAFNLLELANDLYLASRS
jgi:hypothetical protein